MRRIDISSGDLHTTLDLDNEEAVRAHVTMLHDELTRLRAALASAESRLAIVVEALEAWVQYDDADPQVKGECLREARERTALSQVRSKP